MTICKTDSGTSNFIGCSGYYYPEWKEIFYPKDLPKKDWLRFYSEHFNTLEINNTFYRFPELKLFNSWFDRSPDHFKFSVKVPRIITQYRKFNDVSTLLSDFYTMVSDGLQDKTGSILFQLPPSFHYSPEHLERILNNVNPNFINVVEFRHQSWWQKNVYATFKENNITFCSISHPALPDDLIQTSEIIYIRFHGTPELYRSACSEEDLKNWAEKIYDLKNVKCIFIYFNNTMTAKAINNAKKMKELLLQIPGYNLL